MRLFEQLARWYVLGQDGAGCLLQSPDVVKGVAIKGWDAGLQLHGANKRKGRREDLLLHAIGRGQE